MVIVAMHRPQLNSNCVNGCISWHSSIRVLGIGGLPRCCARKVGTLVNDTFNDTGETKGYSAWGFDGLAANRHPSESCVDVGLHCGCDRARRGATDTDDPR